MCLISVATATRLWTPEEIKSHLLLYQPNWSPRPETLDIGPRRFNYLQRIKLLCDFLTRYQVSDSNSPDFGGIIEAEHLPGIIETDNTQEALWVWTRWFELTGRDEYRENIRRAWRYIINHPAYREHEGNPANIWYAVWNCGLGMWAEACYRRVYQDSNYLFYGDSCRNFYLTNPLNSANFLDNFVIAQASGMAYNYARERNDTVLKDTAITRGVRIKNWIEEDARYRLSFQTWAMCGGTAFWGVAQTYCQEDTTAGKNWLNTYSESLPGFYPTGTWNCSHNIWLANAYWASAEITRNQNHLIYHQYLTDTLLMKDTDLDGGIPATWTDPNTQDQTWVSTYLDFMGMDKLAGPIYDNDLSLLDFLQPDPNRLYIIGDTVSVLLPIANVGRNTSSPATLTLDLAGIPVESIAIPPIPFLDTDTVSFSSFPLFSPGETELRATITNDENPANDTTRRRFKVYKLCSIIGTLLDSITGSPVQAVIKTRLLGRNELWDSTHTDTAGNFSFTLVDSVFAITIAPQPPYYSRTYLIRFNRDTAVTLFALPAKVLVVNNDTLANYHSFYTAALDTLGVSYSLWFRQTGGAIPGSLLDRLQNRTVIWFSGNTRNQTVPAPDRETLALFLSRNGNLLLTGQNIAEELAGTPFLESIIGCRFDSSGYSGFLVFGSRQDPVGREVTGAATAGGNGANNQISRDIISPNGTARLFLVYDTTNNLGAGLRNQLPSGSRVIILGFGFEAVNRPASRPNYFTRVQLMNTMLNWLFYGTGITELSSRFNENPPLKISPTIFTNRIAITSHQPAQIFLFDATGRQVAKLPVTSGTTFWQLNQLPAGSYFIKTANTLPVRLLKLK